MLSIPRFVMLFLIGLVIHPVHGSAASCPELPVTLAAMHDCYRPLVIFAPSATNLELAKQLQELNSGTAALRERNIVVVVITEDQSAVSAKTLGGIPAATFGAEENKQVCRKLHISLMRFTILLVGKDGGEKMRWNSVVSIAELNARVDSMPMRQDEMKKGRP